MQLHLIFAYVFCQSPYTAHMVPLAIGNPLPEHRAKRKSQICKLQICSRCEHARWEVILKQSETANVKQSCWKTLPNPTSTTLCVFLVLGCSWSTPPSLRSGGTEWEGRSRCGSITYSLTRKENTSSAVFCKTHRLRWLQRKTSCYFLCKHCSCAGKVLQVDKCFKGVVIVRRRKARRHFYLLFVLW